MAKAFTIYWTKEGYKNLPEEEPIKCAAGARFKGKVQRGDRIYVTNVQQGKLWLLGAFNVESVLDHARDGKPAEAVRSDEEYLLADVATSSPLRVRPVPTELVESLRFITRQGESSVKFLSPGSLDGQTMRRVRQLTADSAARLEQIINGSGSDWTEAELKEAVVTYLDMARRIRERAPVVKRESYRNLAAKIGRSEKSCEYRMQNISYVLLVMGREWIEGLPPAKNVGVKIGAQIERLIGEVEERHLPPTVGEALAVTKLRGKSIRQRPQGQKVPQTVSTTSTSFVRDPAVKAWVLERAGGNCEACSQSAPFLGADGSPFLEVHHVRTLADGGSDTVTNAVAVCPNCHRRLHFSEDSQAYRQGLYGKVKELDLE